MARTSKKAMAATVTTAEMAADAEIRNAGDVLATAIAARPVPKTEKVRGGPAKLWDHVLRISAERDRRFLQLGDETLELGLVLAGRLQSPNMTPDSERLDAGAYSRLGSMICPRPGS